MSTDLWKSSRVWDQPVWPEPGKQQLFFPGKKKKGAGCRTHPGLVLDVACRVCSPCLRTQRSFHLQFLLGKGSKTWMLSSCPGRKGQMHIQRHPGRGGVSVLMAREPPQLLTCKNCRWLGAIWLSHIITDVSRGVTRRTEALHTQGSHLGKRQNTKAEAAVCWQLHC